MIDIMQYRGTIGAFNLQIFSSIRNIDDRNISAFMVPRLSCRRFRLFRIFIRVLLIITVISHASNFDICKLLNISVNSGNYSKNDVAEILLIGRIINSMPTQNWVKMVGNFFARYLYGNKGQSKGVRVFHLNIRSLQNKVSEVKKVVKNEKPHLLGLSECELKRGSINIDSLKIPGYKLHLPKSWDLFGYARVVLYSNKSFECPRISELEDDHLQTIWVKFGFKNSKVGLYCQGYREHSSNLGRSLACQTEKLNIFVSQWERAVSYGNPSEPNDVFILADMNLDSWKGNWFNASYKLFALAQIVHNACNSLGFSQLVNEVTRAHFNSITKATELSCIDHVYTNCKHKCNAPSVTSFGDSDHDMIGIIRLSKVPSSPVRTIRKRCYKNFSKEDFLSALKYVDWNVVYRCKDVDEAVATFTKLFTLILDEHAPWKKIQQRKGFKPWISEPVKKLISQRDTLKAKAKNLAAMNPAITASTEEIETWNQYKKLRNKINNLKRRDEAKYKTEVIANSLEDPSKMWSTIKGFMNWKTSGTPTQLFCNNKMISKACDVARIMNDYFNQKIENLRSSFDNSTPNYEGVRKAMNFRKCKMYLQHVTSTKVVKIIKSLKTSKSLAVDSYSLKISADIIGPIIHYIVTLSVMQNKFPEPWKYAKVIPIHKKGDVLEKKNYRPVSILSPVSKVLERVVFDQLYHYFSSNKLLHSNSMGFRKNRSTLSAVLQMYDRWIRGAINGDISAVILLDLSAAFDLVCPNLLLEKLCIYGVHKDCLEWVKSYLVGRKQAVWIDHTLSGWLSVQVGVPQGSILGPLLFIIFANDLPFVLTYDLDTYADDSTLTSTQRDISSINDEMNLNCSLVYQWMKDNKLCLNAEKTQLMITGTSRRLQLTDKADLNITMGGHVINESEEKYATLLGVKFMPNLKWHEHLFELKKRLKLRLSGLLKVRNIVSTALLKKVADGIFNSVLIYCIPLWGQCDKGDLRSLQVLQNMTARHVLKMPPRCHRDYLFDELGWLTVYQLSIYHSILNVFKIRIHREPEYLFERLSHDNLRGRIIVPNVRLCLCMKSFCWSGAVFWNKLPEDLRTNSNIAQFKTRLKRWIIENVPRFPD